MKKEIINLLKIKLNNPKFQSDDLRGWSYFPDVMNAGTNYATSVVIELPELEIFAAVLKTADLRLQKTINPKVNSWG